MLIIVRLTVFFCETDFIASLYGWDYYVCNGTICAHVDFF